MHLEEKGNFASRAGYICLLGLTCIFRQISPGCLFLPSSQTREEPSGEKSLILSELSIFFPPALAFFEKRGKGSNFSLPEFHLILFTGNFPSGADAASFFSSPRRRTNFSVFFSQTILGKKNQKSFLIYSSQQRQFPIPKVLCSKCTYYCTQIYRQGCLDHKSLFKYRIELPPCFISK